MVTVYALKNLINNEIYVGISADSVRRLHEHNSGKNRYTKAYMPWSDFYSEELPDYATARVREKFLKTSAGKRFLRKLLEKL